MNFLEEEMHQFNEQRMTQGKYYIVALLIHTYGDPNTLRYVQYIGLVFRNKFSLLNYHKT